MPRQPVSSWILGAMLLVIAAGTGCAVALVGAGAIAGYAVSRDHVELLVERPYPQVWSAALEETKRAGLVQEADQATGRIEALSDGTHVTVTLERVSDTTVRILVKARRHLLPKIDVAQSLATRLARRLG